MRTDLARGHAQDVAQPEQLAFVRVEPCQGMIQVQAPDIAPRVGRSSPFMCVQLPHHADTLSSLVLAGLVGGNAEEPGSELGLVSEGRRPAPKSVPGVLRGVTREVRIPADDQAEAHHVGVVGHDQLGEGGMIALSDACQRRCRSRVGPLHSHWHVHVYLMHETDEVFHASADDMNHVALSLSGTLGV